MRYFSNSFLTGVSVALGVVTILLLSINPSPAFAVCTSPSCKIVFDDSTTGYVIGHGAKINVTDTAPSSNPQITVTSYDSNGVTIGSLILNMMTDPGKDVFLGSPSTNQPTYLMLTTNPNNNNSDPPNLQVVQGGSIKVSYTDTAGNTMVSNSQPIVATDPDPNAPYWPPFPTPSTFQPYKNVIIQCGGTNGRAGTSGDYICDTWKTSTGLVIPFRYAGVTANFKWACDNSDPNGPFEIPPKDYPCPSTQHKDVYVEVDWMQNHEPSKTAIQDVINAYNNAPVNDPDGTKGIHLHVFLSTEIPHKTLISGPNNGADTTDFTQIKNMYFGSPSERNHTGTSPYSGACSASSYTAQCIKNLLTAKRQVFHYALFAHDQASAPQSSGISEVASIAPYGATNDLLISLGEWSYHVGSVDQQEGTFMHELGHNLGLGHGGPYAAASDPNVNCKPNYLSVMSWTRQLSDLFAPVGGRPLTYSSEGENGPNPNSAFIIDETKNPIPENAVTNLPNPYTVFSLTSGGFSAPTPANNPDWDQDSGTTTEGSPNDDDVTPIQNQNNQLTTGVFYNTTIASSAPSITVTCPGVAATVLHTWDDWDALMFDMTPTSSFADGAGGTNTGGYKK